MSKTNKPKPQQKGPRNPLIKEAFLTSGAPLVEIVRYEFEKRHPDYGQSITCFACGRPHKARGVARIASGDITIKLPLCAHCLTDDAAVDKAVDELLGTKPVVVAPGSDLKN